MIIYKGYGALWCVIALLQYSRPQGSTPGQAMSQHGIACHLPTSTRGEPTISGAYAHTCLRICCGVSRHGETTVLSTVVVDSTLLDQDFMPLQVDYREKMFAAGFIPGNFQRREIRYVMQGWLSPQLHTSTASSASGPPSPVPRSKTSSTLEL